jgi:hypothetical protein
MRTPQAARWPRSRSARAALGALVVQVAFLAAAAEPVAGSSSFERPNMATANKAASVASARSAAEKLLPLLAVQLGAWHRVSLEMPKAPRHPGSPSPLMATYEREGARASVSVSDAGAPSAVVAQWKGGAVERDVDGAHESMFKVAGHVVTERHRAATHESSVVVLLANGVSVSASSRTADATALRALLESMDLAAAEK